MIFLWKKHNNFVVLFELWRHKKIANKRKSKRDTRKEITTESTRRIVVKYSSYLINLQRYQRQNYIFVFFFFAVFPWLYFRYNGAQKKLWQYQTIANKEIRKIEYRMIKKNYTKTQKFVTWIKMERIIYFVSIKWQRKERKKKLWINF